MAQTETQHPEEAPFWVGNWYVSPGTGRIIREGAEVKLEPKVMSVLVLLAQHPGDVVSRQYLEDHAWQGVVVTYEALTSTVIKLRKALEDDSRRPRYIETISKKGYRLIALVSHEQPHLTRPGLPSSAAFDPCRCWPVPWACWCWW